MPVSLSLQNGQHCTISDARLNVLAELSQRCNRDLDLNIPKVREAAREVISRMGPFDRILDWLFHGEAKQKALLAIADLFIMLRKQAIAPLTADESATRYLAQRELIASLGDEGRKVFLENYHETDDGVQFTPNTKNPAFDSVFCMTLSHGEAGELIEQASGPLEAANAYGRWAANAETPEEKAQLYARQARAYEAGQDYMNASHSWSNCAYLVDPDDIDLQLMNWAVDHEHKLATMKSNAVEFRALDRASQHAASAWSQAQACAAKAGAQDAAAGYARRMNACILQAGKFKALSYRAEALVSQDYFSRKSDFYRREAQAWTEIGASTLAVEAWENYDATCRARANDSLTNIRDDARTSASANAYRTAATIARNAQTSLRQAQNFDRLMGHDVAILRKLEEGQRKIADGWIQKFV